VALGPPRVLALRPLGLGDLMTAVPALRALLDAFPGSRVQVAIPRALAPLLELVPGGGRLQAVDATPLRPPAPEARGAAVAVNLHGRGPQSHRVLLATGAGRIVAFRNDRVPEIDGPRWRRGEHEVRRWCRLLSESGIPADPGRLDIDVPARPPPAGAAGATLIHPGAAATGRRWPAERWAEVARRERAAGRRVVVTGSAAERPLARAIAGAAGLGSGAVLAGRTDVVGLAAAVAAAERVVCADTGVAHVATALRRPSVVLFGPTPPGEWGPPAQGGRHRVVWTGGRGDPHAEVTDPGLLAITADAVIGELSALEPSLA
jgi:ADP-heptose:LPS heptosyltransferase